MTSHELDPQLNPVPENKNDPNFYEQYRSLHMHIFENLTKRSKISSETTNSVCSFAWFFDSIEIMKTNQGVYFQGKFFFVLNPFYLLQYFQVKLCQIKITITIYF